MTVTKRKCECGRRLLQPRERKCALCKAERRKQTSREYRVAKTYGLSAAAYQALVEKADGRCMCCGETRPKGYHWHVDHDHTVERISGDSAYSVRGLICARCNSLLRKGRDSWSLFRDVMTYLTAWPSAPALDGITEVHGHTLDRRAK